MAYYHENTRDYAYYAAANGVGAAVLFQRGNPLSDAALRWFPRQLQQDEGIEFPRWHTIEDLVGTPTGFRHGDRSKPGSRSEPSGWYRYIGPG